MKNNKRKLEKQKVFQKQKESKLKFELQQTIASDYNLLSDVESELKSLIIDNCRLESTDEILIGLHEILCNAIKYGNNEIESREVGITLRITDQYLEFRIEDQGTGFNWKINQGQVLNLIDCTENGRGIAIAEKCYDYLFYNEQGNEVFLFRQLMGSDKDGLD